MKLVNYKTVIIFAIVSLLSQMAFAQNDFNVIKGRIKNSSNYKNIRFVNISIVGTNISTVSNIDGEFLIKIKKSLNAQQLEFKHIGFKSKIINITDLKSGNNVIYLDPSDIMLKEVKVRPDNARNLVQLAFQNTKKNYSNRALNAQGFYRETIKKGRDYLTIAEALIDIYKASYTNVLDNDRVQIYKGRKSNDVKHADTLLVKMKGGPRISLLLDAVKHPTTLISDFNDYNLKVDGVKMIDGRLVYAIAFYPATNMREYPLLIGNFFIDIEALAIAAIEFSVDLSDTKKATKAFIRKKPVGVKITPVKTMYVVHYKQFKGRYFLDYTRSEIKFRCNWRKKLFNSNYTIMSELAITNWDTKEAEKIKYKNSFKHNDIFEEKVSAFADKNFWGEHNTIEPEKSIETAIKKYQKLIKKQQKHNVTPH